MIRRMLILVMLAAAPSAAQAQLYISGNDTGGMIPWSPESERLAVAAADAHCAGYGTLVPKTKREPLRAPAHVGAVSDRGQPFTPSGMTLPLRHASISVS